MKKTRAYALLLAGAILISLTECGNSTQTAEKESSTPAPQIIRPADVTSDTGISDDITAEELSPPAAEPESSETTEQIPAPTAEEKMQEAPPKENTVTPPPAQSKQPIKTQTPTQSESPKPEESKPTPPQPVQPQAPAPTEPKPPVEQPNEEAKTPEFDIEYWITFAKNYAVSIGLELSPAATECWDNPIIAGAHSKYLERDIKDCLNCYKNIEGFTGVWIWAEPDGNGAYKLYIGYE